MLSHESTKYVERWLILLTVLLWIENIPLDFDVEDEKREVYSQFRCLEYCKMCCRLQNILFREPSCILVEGPALVIQIIEIKLRLHMLPGKK